MTNTLSEEIDVAFAQHPYPGDDRIVMREPGCAGLEAEAVWEFFHGKSWQEITLESLKPKLVSLDVLWLTYEGFAYFLPSFMKISLPLDDPYGLEGPVISHLWTFPEEISALLTPPEKLAVVHFLEYMSAELERRWPGSRHDASTALDHYWAYFTDAELGLA